MKAPVMKQPFLLDRMTRKVSRRRQEKRMAVLEAERRGYYHTPGTVDTMSLALYAFWAVMIAFLFMYIWSALENDSKKREEYNNKTTAVYQEVLHRNPTDTERKRILDADSDYNFEKQDVISIIKQTEEYKELKKS